MLCAAMLLCNVQVRFEAVKASVAFIVANDDDKVVLAHFKSLLPPLLLVSNAYIN